MTQFKIHSVRSHVNTFNTATRNAKRECVNYVSLQKDRRSKIENHACCYRNIMLGLNVNCPESQFIPALPEAKTPPTFLTKQNSLGY